MAASNLGFRFQVFSSWLAQIAHKTPPSSKEHSMTLAYRVAGSTGSIRNTRKRRTFATA